MRWRVIETPIGYYLVQTRPNWWPFWSTDEGDYGPNEYTTLSQAINTARVLTSPKRRNVVVASDTSTL